MHNTLAKPIIISKHTYLRTIAKCKDSAYFIANFIRVVSALIFALAIEGSHLSLIAKPTSLAYSTY